MSCVANCRSKLLKQSRLPMCPLRAPRRMGPCERTSGCTHLKNRIKYRDLGDAQFLRRCHVGRGASIDKTHVFALVDNRPKRCVHRLVRTQEPITTGRGFTEGGSRFASSKDYAVWVPAF